jgi:hypothetical protein
MELEACTHRLVRIPLRPDSPDDLPQLLSPLPANSCQITSPRFCSAMADITEP